MTKDDAPDLVVKAFGVGLLVAAIAAIPAMVERVIHLRIFTLLDPTGDGQEFTDNYWNMAESAQLASSFGALARSLVFALALYDFLRSGSLVRRLMGRSAEPADERQSH